MYLSPTCHTCEHIAKEKPPHVLLNKLGGAVLVKAINNVYSFFGATH